jgi:hypothetical protein
MYLVSLLKEMSSFISHLEGTSKSTFILRKYFYSGIGSHLENSRHFEKKTRWLTGFSNKYPKGSPRANFYACTTN